MKKIFSLSSIFLLALPYAQARVGGWNENRLTFQNFGQAIVLRPPSEAYYFGRDNPNLGNLTLPGGSENSHDYVIPTDTWISADNQFGVGFTFTPTNVNEVTPGSGIYFIRTNNGSTLKIKLEGKPTNSGANYAPLSKDNILHGPIWYGGKPPQASNLATGVDVRATLLIDDASYQGTQDANTPQVLNFPEIELGRIRMTVDNSSGVNHACCGKQGGVWIVDTEGQKVKLAQTVVTLRPQSCTVTAGNETQSISLRTIKKRDIPTLGSTADAGEFRISLNCNKLNNVRTNGQFNPIQNVAVTFTAFNTDGTSQTNNGTSPMLPIEKGQGKAEGVALKILQGSSAVNFGRDSALKNNPGAVNLGAINGVNGTFYTFKTQYVNSSGNVKGGDVRAKASFTLSYQ